MVTRARAIRSEAVRAGTRTRRDLVALAASSGFWVFAGWWCARVVLGL